MLRTVTPSGSPITPDSSPFVPIGVAPQYAAPRAAIGPAAEKSWLKRRCRS
jgi:hypothetical protein